MTSKFKEYLRDMNDVAGYMKRNNITDLTKLLPNSPTSRPITRSVKRLGRQAPRGKPIQA